MSINIDFTLLVAEEPREKERKNINKRNKELISNLNTSIIYYTLTTMTLSTL